jgi:hypothetical protein
MAAAEEKNLLLLSAKNEATIKNSKGSALKDNFKLQHQWTQKERARKAIDSPADYPPHYASNPRPNEHTQQLHTINLTSGAVILPKTHNLP